MAGTAPPGATATAVPAAGAGLRSSNRAGVGETLQLPSVPSWLVAVVGVAAVAMAVASVAGGKLLTTPAVDATGGALALFFFFLVLRLRLSWSWWQKPHSYPFRQRPRGWKQHRLQVPEACDSEPMDGCSAPGGGFGTSSGARECGCSAASESATLSSSSSSSSSPNSAEGRMQPSSLHPAPGQVASTALVGRLELEASSNSSSISAGDFSCPGEWACAGACAGTATGAAESVAVCRGCGSGDRTCSCCTPADRADLGVSAYGSGAHPSEA
mmetsp:Transcript_101465/g.302649  ORF Transcript_101465/g.302649 Transcript_101465/m.302649 type:complete len:271 (-) Transcript_101465:650-1462(-)